MGDLKKITVSGPREKEPEGLKDGGHVILSCANCKAGLLKIWITRPDEIDELTGEPFEWKVQANCPFCGDKSFVADVRGGYHIGGYGIPKPEDENDTIPSTAFTGEFEEKKGGVLFFKVEKYSPDAKPQKVRR